MGVHMPTSPMPYQASRRGVAPVHGRKLPIGIAAPAAVVQPQRRQRHAEPLARTWKRRFRAQAPRCRCARAARHRPPPSGGQDPPPGSRLERHVVNPSIAVPGRADRSRSFSSTILTSSRTCLKEGSSKTESPSQPNSGKTPPDTFTHLLTQPPRRLLERTVGTPSHVSIVESPASNRVTELINKFTTPSDNGSPWRAGAHPSGGHSRRHSITSLLVASAFQRVGFSRGLVVVAQPERECY